MLLNHYKQTLQDMSHHKVTNTEIAKVLNTTPQNISKRIKTNSELTVAELSKLENTFGIFTYSKADVGLSHSLEKRKADFKEAFNTWGARLSKIALNAGLDEYKMADTLGISVDYYFDIVYNENNPKPPLELIKTIVENFDVDLNWLLIGEPSMVSSKHSDIINSLPPEKFDKLIKLLDD